MASDPSNDFRQGDLDYTLLRKILMRMLAVMEAIETVAPTVVIEPGNVEIGSVVIKDGVNADIADVKTSAPTSGEPGLVTRNIPSGTQGVSGTVAVSNLPVTQPVSGTVAVSNLPATQPVSGAVSVSNLPASQVVSNPTDSSEPILDAARLGLVYGKGAYAYHVLGRRIGFNSTSVLQDVAEFLGTSIDAIPELTGAENFEIVSSSANDTALGSGARTVKVAYIDTSNNLTVTSDIALNGVTPVATAFHAHCILWMEVTSVGAALNAVAVGTILLRIAGAGATHEQITAGGNRSMTNRFMVPAGHQGYICSWQVSSIGSANQDARLRGTVQTADRTLNAAYIFQDNALVSAGTSVEEEIPWLRFPALAKVKVSTISSATGNTNRIDTDFTILLIAE